MTDKPTPTDTELKAMWQLHAADIGGIFHYARAVLAKWGQPAQAAEPVAWYEGNPPFPQDQEWFIAETIYGDKAVLRSLDEGREHKGNYAFKTADETYMKAEIIKRWMQFPDCEYLPPTAPQPVAREPLTDAQIVQMSLEWPAETNDWASHIDFARAIEQAHGIKGGQHGTE